MIHRITLTYLLEHFPAASPSVRSLPKKICTLERSTFRSASATSGLTVVPDPMEIENESVFEIASTANSSTLSTMKSPTASRRMSFFMICTLRLSGNTISASPTLKNIIRRRKKIATMNV